MSKDWVNTIVVTGLLGSIALESFMIGKSGMIDYFLSSNFPLIYFVFNEILTVITVGFVSFFLLGVAVLTFDKEIEE